jgi:hypothetical protein
MGVNKRLEIADKAPDPASAEVGDNKMDQIRELMFGGARACGKTWSGPSTKYRTPRPC